MKRFIGMVIALIGVASLVFGIVFIIQSNSGKQEVADEIAPLTLSEVDAKYDTVSASHNQLKAAEEPKIQQGQAQPSAMYNYLSAQRALLGLAKSNIGLTSSVMMNGIVDIVLGFGLILVGGTMLVKKAA